MTLTILDVGQGDGIFIENGGSRVVIDAGQGTTRIANFIAQSGLAGDTIDLMIMSHDHFDHHGGLREYFKSKHDITILRFFENRDAADGQTLAELRDSVDARAARGELEIVDTDDPCGNGQALCTFKLAGGARLHMMRPFLGTSANNRSVAIKLLGPDSSSFSAWLSGDAEHEAIRYFETTFGSNPGLDVDVLKANHHGSCNGVLRTFLEKTSPEWVTIGVSSTNSFGHVHEQTKALMQELGVQWLRTDENGTIRFQTAGLPNSSYTVSVERGASNMDGQADEVSAQSACAAL